LEVKKYICTFVALFNDKYYSKMDNKISKRIKILIAAVLVLFMAIVMSDFWPDARDGFMDGWNSVRGDSTAIANVAHRGGRRHLTAVIVPVDGVASPQRFADGIEFRTFKATGNLVLPENVARRPAWLRAGKQFAVLAGGLAALTLLFYLVVFVVKFPRRRITSRENIVSMRWIAGSLMVYGLCECLFVLVDYLWLRSHVTLDGYRVVMDHSFATAMIVALIIWAMTEIMNLAGKLQQEQELTI
jgi:hypothetical protein